jgi:transposase
LFKAGLVQQSLQPGASVAAIALQNGVNANLLFKWRRDHLRATRSTSTERAVLLPVHVLQATEVTATSTPITSIPVVPMNRGARAGFIELEMAGARLCLRGAVDEASLCSVLRALRQSA